MYLSTERETTSSESDLLRRENAMIVRNIWLFAFLPQTLPFRTKAIEVQRIVTEIRNIMFAIRIHWAMVVWMIPESNRRLPNVADRRIKPECRSHDGRS